jgi:3-hydroxyisobutyrate dehydrogenase
MKDAGHAVRGFDIDPNACKRARELGIEVVDSIAAAVADAEVVFTMVPAGPDVKQVLTAKDGAFANAPKVILAIDCSTIGDEANV